MTVDMNDSKLEFIYKFGAAHTINSKSKNAVKKIMAITNGLEQVLYLTHLEVHK